MLEVAEEYLSRKGQTLDDYLDYIKQPGNKDDELALHIMACMANISTIVVTKTGVWSTFNGEVSDAELVLVYLGKSTFQDMVPIPPPNQNPSPLTRMCMNMKMVLNIQIDTLQGPWVKPPHHPPCRPSQLSLSENGASQKVVKGSQELKL